MNRRYIVNVLLSMGISFLLLAILIGSFSGVTDPAGRPRLLSILGSTSLGFIGFYLLSGISQTLLRALRYRVILRSGVRGEEVPGIFHLFIVAMSRNMFVDMLPARLGEFSYVAMLNRGYRIGADACLSSLAISFVFDLIALAVLLLVLLVYQLLFASLQPWIIGTFLLILLVSSIILFFLFPVLHWLQGWLHGLQWGNGRIAGLAERLACLVEDTAASLQQVRDGRIFGRVLALSMGVRIFKYLGLYLLFLGVVLPSFPDIDRTLASVFIALVSAEASAGMPVPAFMSFGTYEAGGALALVALGAVKATSIMVMLALHIWSQVVDYALGITATVVFVFVMGRRADSRVRSAAGTGKSWTGLWIAVAGVLLCIGLFFFAFQVRNVRKMGSFTPPKPGKPVLTAASERPLDPTLAKLNGFVVWSSNRSGSHDLLMLSLPGQELTRLTSDSHTDYFPRISPDGSKLVFCRSREPWVSQRNYFAWDVYLLELATGRVSLLTKNGNTPTWSADGTKIYFQRQGNQFVEYRLADKKERVLLESGSNLPFDASVMLETPAWNEYSKVLAVTLRGGARGTFIIDAVADQVAVRQVGGGCQLNWAPDSSFLYQVDHGGRGGNAFYRIDPATLDRQLWYDAPEPYSHEYFPKLANNGKVLVFGASTGGHEHDKADYEIFLWPVGAPESATVRLSFHTGNDNWPDIFLTK
jgi:uncharacterized membrane protein YbhN (UPF0104 family)